MASECTATFILSFALGTDAEIAIDGSPTVALVPGFNQIYRWTLYFTYVSGEPPAIAFRLDSLDTPGELGSGTFTPPVPVSGDDPSEVRNGVCSGTVTVVLPPNTQKTYKGRITIIQE